MIFLANRANLDQRTLLTRLHNRLQTQVQTEESPVEQVWYHTSAGNKVGVRAAVNPSAFVGATYATDVAELHVSFDFPPNRSHDFYKIQWVEPERELMIGWHQDETHRDLGECHFQIDHRDETIQRDAAVFLDTHPLNVFDQRTDHLVEVLDALTWENGVPTFPEGSVQ